MELFITDIPEDGLHLDLDSAKDVWFGRVMKEALGDVFGDTDVAKLKLSIQRADDDIDIVGEMRLMSHPTCDRCLEPFAEDLTIPLHIHMAPLYESERQREREQEEGFEVELVKEDMEFSYYEGDRIYLDEIIGEQVLLAMPMKRLCVEECKGLCQHCGKNLNDGPCGCKEAHADSRWEALKNFKPARG